jgi:hypothetical protein
MDRQVLVGQIQKLEREMRKRHGPIALLMLVSPDPAVDDEWNIVVSAKGLDKVSRAEGVRELTSLMRRALAKNLWPGIRRATVLRTDDPFVEAITTSFHTTGSVIDLNSCNVFGFEIAKGVLFTSKKVAA